VSGAKRALVTGASGFIGRYTLPELLRQGYEVHAVVRRDLTDVSPAVIRHAVDLLEEGAAAALVQQVRPSHLLHLAWNAIPGQFWQAPDNLDWVAASLRLYRAFVGVGGKRAVFAGTCAEYDWSHDWLDETQTPLLPATLYGVAKHALHEIVAAAAPQDGVSVAWGRVFFLYGPYEHPSRLVPDVMLSLLNGQPARCGSGLAERDLMHVEDVARAFVAILDSDYSGPVNIASGACRPLGEVIATIADMIGRPELVRLGARETPAAEPSRLSATTDILNETIGFKPAYDLASGLSQTLDWWRAHRPSTAG
jgi:nucleoside-diphosphate-sugar epimerase